MYIEIISHNIVKHNIELNMNINIKYNLYTVYNIQCILYTYIMLIIIFISNEYILITILTTMIIYYNN